MDTPRNTMFQFSLRTLLEVTALVAIILAIFFTRGTNQSGRYHYLQTERWGLIVYDSQTGNFWQKTDSAWYAVDGPPAEGKK